MKKSYTDPLNHESLAQRFPASSVLAREGAGCGSVGDVTGAWLVQTAKGYSNETSVKVREA